MTTRLLTWFKRKQQNGYLAIQAGAGVLSHAELNWQNGRPNLTSCISRPDDGESAKSWGVFGNSPVPVGVVLSAGEYQLLPIDAPPVPLDEMKMAVRWKIKDQIEFPVDDATVDVIRLESGAEASGKLLAVVAHNRVLKKYMGLAERAHFNLVAIDIPELAQRNIAALLETPDRVLALLSFTPQGGLLTVTRNGELCFHRRLECNPVELMEQDADRRSVVFDRLALELQRSLDHIERQHSGWRLDKIVLAPPPVVPGMADYLRQQLYLPLELADLTALFPSQLPAEPDKLAACWFALGGALRREDKAL
ncbi:MAG: agglutinin biogenesis protein MshI [Thiobacillus sp.]|nr:agglutinin biogenesis protein MshI [Thiobacillus sp.]